MLLSNKHDLYNGLCSGCFAAIKQLDVNPDDLYNKMLCSRCQAELEALPPRHKKTFDELKKKLEKADGRIKFLEGKIQIYESHMIRHGMSPQEAGSDYRSGIFKTLASDFGIGMPVT